MHFSQVDRINASKDLTTICMYCLPSKKICSVNYLTRVKHCKTKEHPLIIVEAKLSKFILIMPKTQVKNQESSKFQESKSRSIKNQDSSEDSRKDSRYARTSRKTSR